VTATSSRSPRPLAGSKRWLGVGRSSASDPAHAGAAATSAAITGTDPQLLIVFCADTYCLEELLQAIASAAPGVPLVGCSTAGEISTGGPSDDGVVVLAIGGEGFSVSTGSGIVGAGGLRDAAAGAAACAGALEGRPHSVLLLLSDGLAGDQQEVVRGAYSVVGAAMPLVGGCAGDGLKMQATYQFHGTDVLQGAVVAAAIASDGPLGIGVRHGWRRVGEPMVVTASEDSRVFSLDDRPALDVYLDRLAAPPDVREDPAAFTRFALTHPLGISRRSGEEVRFVAEADFAERSIVCIAQVPQGGLAWFMEGDNESVLGATVEACSDALAPLEGQPPLGMMAFDCIARRGVLGEDGIGEEVGRIADFADGAPVAGFYTYGEIARTRGINGFHNQTLVVLAVG
jgi:hypothetical protein